jgi:hypothetical protein
MCQLLIMLVVFPTVLQHHANSSTYFFTCYFSDFYIFLHYVSECLFSFSVYNTRIMNNTKNVVDVFYFQKMSIIIYFDIFLKILHYIYCNPLFKKDQLVMLLVEDQCCLFYI